MNRTFNRLARIAAIVAFLVIVLGAWVRLSHAGLGCPDWPGCYGQLTWPVAAAEVRVANEAFPERPVESHKAWKEMVHRYLAGTLVLLVLALNRLAWRRNDGVPAFRGKATFALVLIMLQALLGMWTVTLQLLPLVVMAHLLGGLVTFALLLWIWLRSRSAHVYSPGAQLRAMRRWVILALSVLVVQIALGGWTSANYSALACPDLPTCAGQWWPETDFREGFVLWREIGVDYEGGILDQPARTAIHLTHRIGAVVTLLTLLFVAARLMRVATFQRFGALLALLVLVQFALGVFNVALQLPLTNAVAHNGVAALLLAVLITLLYRTTPGSN
jgi:cytochrome c oxidase assembly protein subunit 15